jgi:serine O-acetyltransferase
MYDNKIPDVFLIVHGIGTIMGKAEYSNYFVIYQGCTIGASHGIYPKIGAGVTITANSSVIGKSIIGNRATISTRTTIFQKEVPKDYTAFIDWDKGKLQMKKSNICYAQQFFNIDLKTL